MRKRPKIRTMFIIWEKEKPNKALRDAEVRKWIYHNGKRGTQYHVDEISETGEIQNTYIYKYTTEGPIFRKKIYSKWKEEIKQAERDKKNCFQAGKGNSRSNHIQHIIMAAISMYKQLIHS